MPAEPTPPEALSDPPEPTVEEPRVPTDTTPPPELADLARAGC